MGFSPSSSTTKIRIVIQEQPGVVPAPLRIATAGFFDNLVLAAASDTVVITDRGHRFSRG